MGGSSNFNLSLPPVSSDKSQEVASSQNPTNSECSVDSKIDSKDDVEVSSVESKINRKEEVENSKEKEINVDEENLNFENIKSRLRPRNENINYYKVSIVQSPVANKTNHDEKPRAFKRKDIEMKQVAFLLPTSKRRRRNSEHHLKLSNQDNVPEIDDKKYRRIRRKSGI